MKNGITLLLLLSLISAVIAADPVDNAAVKKAQAQRKGVDLLTASEVTIGRNADGTPIKVKIIRDGGVDVLKK